MYVFNGGYVLGVDTVSWREAVMSLLGEVPMSLVGVIGYSPVPLKKVFFLNYPSPRELFD